MKVFELRDFVPRAICMEKDTANVNILFQNLN